MRILIVDDDTSVIQTLLATLKTLPGHDVRVATSGEKAIEHASAMGGVDLLITDVVMEPMDGFTLRDQIHARYPDTRTILISGYDLSDYPEQTEYHQLLQKPFDAPALVAAVQREIALVPAAPVAGRATARAAVAAAVPSVRATAAPAGIPRPRAVPGAQPMARATAVATAGPVARGVQPNAVQPRAVAANAVPQHMAAVPRAVAPAAAPPSPFATRQAPPAPEGAGESLIGQTIGAYQIVSYLGEGRLGSAYAAVQISINRPVGLKVLDPSRAQDESIKARFIADARAKAHVQHPAILAVYEAGEAVGRIFYAREYVDGQSLSEIAAGRQALDEKTALKIIRVVAEGFVYLTSHNIPHRPLEPGKVFLGMDGQPRLANLAVQVADEVYTTEQEIGLLGQIMVHVVPGAQILSPAMNALLTRMIQAQSSGLNAWGHVIQEVKALEPKIVPVEAARITAQDQAAIQAVETARKQQKRNFWINVISLSTLFAIFVFIALKKFVFTNERAVQKMVKISAGTYKLAGGKSVVIERDYWIDKYEVTWGQYSRFLEYLDKNPTSDQDFRHPRMPRHLTHDNSDLRIYLPNARAGTKVQSTPIDLNCPVFAITWWDAHAYAKWLGTQTGTERDLPTVEEWEVAASGTKGEKFVWGSDDSSGVNTGADYDPKQLSADPKNGWKGKIDGYNLWSPVDALSGDRSPTGVFGLGGNVAEWTSTWTADNRFPIIKGGSFNIKPQPISYRIENHEPDKIEPWLGFRTISRTAPPDAE
jgi:formylglycine-generating enzyme required for sulfatase activity/CheY-like chemotaxis protein